MSLNSFSKDERERLKFVGQNCACNSLRKAARVVTRRFDEIYSECGLRSTQAPILLELGLNGPLAMSELADRLAVEKSTLSRNLIRVEEKGLVGRERLYDGQIRLSLTSAGEDALRKIIPLWEAAQAEVMELVDESDWRELLQTAEKITTLADRP